MGSGLLAGSCCVGGLLVVHWWSPVSWWAPCSLSLCGDLRRDIFFVKLVVMLTVHGFLPVSGCEVRGFVAFSFLFCYLRRNCSFMGLRSSGVGVCFCVERVSFK